MIIFRKNKRLVFLIILCLLLLPLFQNCLNTPLQFNQNSPEPSVDEHGQGYGGLRKGDFYRFVPDFTCEKQEKPVAEISNSGSQILLTENKKLKCGALTQTLDSSQVDVSIYQNDVIGYREGIFEGAATTPIQIPANLVEVWCRTANDKNGIETITHFDRVSKIAVNKTFYSDQNLNQKQISDFSVSRVIAPRLITIKNENGFELKVFRDQPAPTIGLFRGHLKSLIEGQNISRETFCRLGGSVDPKVWPSRQVVDVGIQEMVTSPDLNNFVYSSNDLTGIYNLYAGNLNSTDQYQVGQKMLSNSPASSFAGKFNFSQDASSIIYTGNTQSQNLMQLFKFNLFGDHSSALTSLDLGTDSVQDFTMSQDSKFIVYEGYYTQSGLPQKWLKAISSSGGTPVTLSNSATSGGIYSSPTYAISNSLNKVVYLEEKTFFDSTELYSINFDGSNLIKITPHFSSADWQLDFTPGLFIPNGGKYVFALARRHLSAGSVASDLKYYMIAVDGSGSSEIPQNWMWYFSDSSGTYAVIGNSLTSNVINQMKLMNFQTNTLILLPQLQIDGAIPFSDGNFGLLASSQNESLFFSKDSSALIGRAILPDGNLKAVSISTSNGVSSEVCPNLTSKNLHIEELDQNSFLLVAEDSNHQMLNVYIKRPGVDCEKVNSLPDIRLSHFPSLKVSVSPDQEKILITAQILENSTGVDEILYRLWYIPLNGRPSFVVSTPVEKTSYVNRAFFLADSQSIFYVGNQITQNQDNAFLWKIPQD